MGEKEIWLQLKRASKEYQCDPMQELKTGEEKGAGTRENGAGGVTEEGKGVQQFMTLLPPAFKAPPMHFLQVHLNLPPKTCTAP